jgi:hypothetical protein
MIKHLTRRPGYPFDVSAEDKVRFTSDGGAEAIGALHDLLVGARERCWLRVVQFSWSFTEVGHNILRSYAVTKNSVSGWVEVLVSQRSF